MGKTAILAIRIIGDAVEATAAFEDAEKAGKSFEDSMSKLKDGVKIAGAAAGAALAAGVYGGIENAQAGNKLAAQLGLDPAESERLGGIAGRLYADAYGESLSAVNDALRFVQGDIEGMATTSDADLERITGKVISLSDAFDQDLGATTAAVGQMIRTGMASDVDEALDIITRGLQSSARAGEDLLDTYVEYPALFERLGVSGEVAGGLIAQGMEAGARSTDLVADALKEFQIRSIDASTASADAYAALGLDADEMTATMARGGADAAGGLQLVLDRLRGMTDPVAQNAAAVGLFGTQAEDLGAALFALDPSTAVAALGDVAGASERLNETMSNDQAFEKLQRAVVQTFTDMGAAALPVLEPILNGLREFAPILGPVAIALAVAAGAVTVVSAAMKVYAAVQAIQTAAQWASNAAWLASPITWIVLAIVAAIALVVAAVLLVIQHWQDLQRFGVETWENIMRAVDLARRGFDIALNAIGNWWNGLVEDWRRGFDSLIGWIRNALDWLGRLVSNAVPGWMKDLFGMTQTFSARMIVEEPDPGARMAFTAAETMAGFSQSAARATSTAGLSSSALDRGILSASEPTSARVTNVKIEFNGLVTDREGVAREIRKVLQESDKTNGRAPAVGVGA